VFFNHAILDIRLLNALATLRKNSYLFELHRRNKMTTINHLEHDPQGLLAHPGHVLNREWWDEVTPVHAASEFYDVDGFLAGKSALDRLELDWLGMLRGSECCTCNVTSEVND
jgi:hypothetical protein